MKFISILALIFVSMTSLASSRRRSRVGVACGTAEGLKLCDAPLHCCDGDQKGDKIGTCEESCPAGEEITARRRRY